MSESEPSRLQMSTANMGMGGSLPPLSLPPLSLPPMKTDPLGLSPHSYNSISQLHSPIPNTASPSNHVNSPQPQMFNQPPSSPLAYGNGSPRQMPVKRRFPMGQEPGSPFQQRQGMESLPKQMKVLPGPPVSGANPPISPMRFQEPVASPSSSFAPSPSNVPSPSTSHHLPNGNGPVHPQALKTSQASAQPVPMQMPPQPHPPQQPLHPLPQQMPQQHPVNMAEFRGTPNGTFHPAVSSAPSPNLYHKPRPVEANAQVHQLQHLQMRPSTSHQPNMVQPGHHMQNLPNAQMPVPQMFPTQQHHMFPTQGIPGQVIGQPPVGFAPMPQQQGPPQQRMAMQHPQTVQIIQQRMIPGQGVVPVVVQQAPPPQQQQQQAQQQLQPPMSQQQIKNVLANRIGTAPVNGPSPSNTPALQQVLTRTVGARVGQIVSGQLNPTHANIPVRTILSAFQPHQMANGRPGIPVSLPMHPGGQPMIHQATVPRSNPTAAMQLARMIDERMAPSTSSKDQYRAFKKKFKYLVYENECYQEELRNLQRKLLKLSRDKNFLLDRLMQFEKVSDSSDDDSDSSQKTVDDRPKTKKRIRTQKRKSSPHIDGVNSASGTPSPCPSPAPGNLLAQMLQPSTSSGVFSPPGDARLHHPEQQMRMEDRRQFLLQQQLLQQQIQQQQHSGEREMRHPFAPREPAAPMGDPVINGYPAGPHFPSQSSSVPAQSSSHLNGQLPSTPGVAPPASEELDQKPVP